MSAITDIENRATETLTNFKSSLEKDGYVVPLITFCLIIYTTLIAPRLSKDIVKWFDNWLVQIILFFLIAFISQQNITIALIMTIAVVVTIMIANNYVTTKKVTDNLSESFCSVCNDCTVFYNKISNGTPEIIDKLNKKTVSFVDTKQIKYENEFKQENNKNFFNQELDQEHPGSLLSEQENSGSLLSEHEHEQEHEYEHEHEQEHSGSLISEHEQEQNMKKNINHHEDDYDHEQNYVPIDDFKIKKHIPNENHVETEQHFIPNKSNTINNFDYHNNGQTHSKNIVGIEQIEMENDDTSSDIDIIDDSDEPPKSESLPTYINDTIHSSVEQVTAEVENKTKTDVPDEIKEDILNIVKDYVQQLVKKGKQVGDYDVISVCREIYRKRY